MLKKFDTRCLMKLTDKETGIVTEVEMIINLAKPISIMKTLFELGKDYDVECVETW